MAKKIASLDTYLSRDVQMITDLYEYYNHAIGGFKTQSILARRRGDVEKAENWRNIAELYTQQRNQLAPHLLDAKTLRNEHNIRAIQPPQVARRLTDLAVRQTDALAHISTTYGDNTPLNIEWYYDRLDYIHEKSEILEILLTPLEVTLLIEKKSPAPVHRYTIRANNLRELHEQEVKAKESLRMRFGYVPTHSETQAQIWIRKGKTVHQRVDKAGRTFWLLERWSEKRWMEIEKDLTRDFETESDRAKYEKWMQVREEYGEQ